MNVTLLNTVSCYFLHKTHKLDEYIISNRLKRAQTEIDGYNNCTYVLLYMIDTRTQSNLTKAEQKQLETAKTVIGEENIFVVDYKTTNAAFEGIFDDFAESNQGWLINNMAWNMADLPEIVWAQHQFESGVIKSEETIIWCMEYDVLWTGRLGKTLIDGISNKLNHSYVGWNIVEVGESTWFHQNKLYSVNNEQSVFGSVEKAKMMHGLIQLVRFKPNVLRMMIEQLKQRKYSYCEMRAATLCKWFDDECTMAAMQDPANNVTQYFGHFSWTINKEQKKISIKEIKENESNKFYHPIKKEIVYIDLYNHIDL